MTKHPIEVIMSAEQRRRILGGEERLVAATLEVETSVLEIA
ncbi:hypothetical protein [Mesorhizobium sp. LjNodule214]